MYAPGIFNKTRKDDTQLAHFRIASISWKEQARRSCRSPHRRRDYRHNQQQKRHGDGDYNLPHPKPTLRRDIYLSTGSGPVEMCGYCDARAEKQPPSVLPRSSCGSLAARGKSSTRRMIMRGGMTRYDMAKDCGEEVKEFRGKVEDETTPVSESKVTHSQSGHPTAIKGCLVG